MFVSHKSNVLSISDSWIAGFISVFDSKDGACGSTSLTGCSDSEGIGWTHLLIDVCGENCTSKARLENNIVATAEGSVCWERKGSLKWLKSVENSYMMLASCKFSLGLIETETARDFAFKVSFEPIWKRQKEIQLFKKFTFLKFRFTYLVSEASQSSFQLPALVLWE